jgi:DNA-binding CsgD family transcriptional regulator
MTQMGVVRTSSNMAAELALFAQAAPDAPAFRRHALETYGTIVPCDSAVFSEPLRHDPLTTINVDSTAFQAITHCEQNFQRYEADLRRPLDMARREGGFLDHEVYTSRDRRELRLYREVVAPQRIRSTLMLVPCWRGNVVGLIRLQRHGGTPFSRNDLERATRMLPVIELAIVTLRSESGAPGSPCLPKLSVREAEIAGHVERGLTTSQIALILGTSPLTVRNQIVRIFDKTRVASRAELASWVARRRPLSQ